jgi:hypothetical protein
MFSPTVEAYQHTMLPSTSTMRGVGIGARARFHPGHGLSETQRFGLGRFSVTSRLPSHTSFSDFTTAAVGRDSTRSGSRMATAGSAPVAKLYQELLQQPYPSSTALMAATSNTGSDVGTASSARATAGASVSSTAVAGPSALYLAGMFTLWYGFNAAYNVYNAHMKKDFPFPLASASLHLFIGLLYIFPLWLFGIRKAPDLNVEDIMKLVPIGMYCFACMSGIRGE